MREYKGVRPDGNMKQPGPGPPMPQDQKSQRRGSYFLLCNLLENGLFEKIPQQKLSFFMLQIMSFFDPFFKAFDFFNKFTFFA